MWRSSGRLHHRGRYPSLHLNCVCVTLAVFPPVRHPAADEHQFTRDTVTGPPSGIATPNNARADLNPHLVVSPLVFSQSITVTSTYFSALISYMTEIGGKSIPIKKKKQPPPLSLRRISGVEIIGHTRYVVTSPLSWWRSSGGVSSDWVFSPVSPPSSPPATRIITRSGVTRCCLLWSLLSAVVRGLGAVQVLCRYLPSGVNMRGAVWWRAVLTGADMLNNVV